MSVIFDPFSGNLIDIGSSSGGSPTIGGPVIGSTPNTVLAVDNASALAELGPLANGQLLIGSTGNLPSVAALTGTVAQVNITNGSGSITLSLPQSIATTSSPTFTGLTIGALSGVVKASSGVLSASLLNLATEVTGTLGTANGGTGLNTSAATNGQLLIGNGSGLSLSTITGTSNQVTVTNGSGTITLSLPQDIATSSSPTFATVIVAPSGGLDTNSVGTLAVGTSNANIINIGNSGATVNIQGTTYYQNVTDLQVTDKRITINKGGSAGSGSNAGVEIEENSVITAYVDTSADRASWEFKAPSTAGIITLTPGASGFTIDQGSHNPVTIGTANGLSISTQQISLGLSSTSTTGALSSTDWNTFNNKQDAGNYITALTGDVTASGPGSASATLATVNADIGTYNNLTVNAKGLVTAASNVAYLTGNQNITLSGDASGSGTTSISVSISDTTVTSKLITGFSSSAGTITASDSILGAINKLDGNIATKATSVTGDISPTTWSGLSDNTANQAITGLSFSSSIKSFEALLHIRVSASIVTFTTIKLIGTRKDDVDWSVYDLQTEFLGDSIPSLAFTIDSTGQVEITVGSFVSFASGDVTFRATVV